MDQIRHSPSELRDGELLIVFGSADIAGLAHGKLLAPNSPFVGSWLDNEAASAALANLRGKLQASERGPGPHGTSHSGPRSWGVGPPLSSPPSASNPSQFVGRTGYPPSGSALQAPPGFVSRLDTHDLAFSELGRRVASLQSTSEALEIRLRRSETSLHTTTAQTARNTQDLQTVTAQIRELDSRLGSRMSALETLVHGVHSQAHRSSPFNSSLQSYVTGTSTGQPPPNV